MFGRKPEERYILCIDGGGMRGIVPVVLLQKLESIIREKGGTHDIAKYFDLIAGTSTGGLISLALTCESTIEHKDPEDGSSQVDLSALLDKYMTIGDEIFSTRLFTDARKYVDDKYSSNGIQTLVQKWFGTTPVEKAKVPTLIMAYNLSEGMPLMIRSYADEADYPGWVAARATSAAPTYFSPCEHEGLLLADGGVVANNPTIYAYFEAKKLYPKCKRFHILSLSTSGNYHTMKENSTKGMIKWGTQIYPLFDTAQKRTTDYVIAKMQDVDYVRIDDPLPKDVEMDETDPDTLKEIKEAAENIASVHEGILDSFADLLLQHMEDR